MLSFTAALVSGTPAPDGGKQAPEEAKGYTSLQPLQMSSKLIR